MIPVLSVVTPSYNQGRFLGETIRSVTEQPMRESVEHIVIDGASSDNSIAILKANSEHLAYWQSAADGGQSAAINEGFRHATGNILCWINSDDALAPGASSVMIQAMNDVSSPCWAVGQCIYIDESGQKMRLETPTQIQRKEDIAKWRDNHICQPATFWNRAMWEKAGELDESLYYAMDYDLWMRFIDFSPPLILHHPIGIHRVHGQTKTSTATIAPFKEHILVLKSRLANSPSILRSGLSDTALSLTEEANRHMYRRDRALCLQYLALALTISPKTFVNLSTIKSIVKLLNPFHPDMSKS